MDKKLDEACEEIAENVKSRIESVKKDALEKIEELKVKLNDSSIGNCERMKRLLKEAHERLGYISHNINHNINLMTSKQEQAMNETLEQFKKNQERNQEVLKKLLDFIKTGEKYGINIEEFFKDKIRNAIEKCGRSKT